MEPRKHTLAELFEGQLVYVVPSYQRLYVWNQEDQWDPLWSDVEAKANVLAREATSRNAAVVTSSLVEDHFLGAVVLKMSGHTPDLARQLRVIDGQQRLTTLQLLLAATVTELRGVGLTHPADRLKELTANSAKPVSPGTVSFKIRHHRHRRGHDYERFGEVMDAALNGRDTNSLPGPMAECYRFFQKAIRKWLNGRQEYLQAAASALATTLLLKLNLVGIYLDPGDKEHIIFETLNARGEPLTEWDKIKNFLLYKAEEAASLDQETFFEAYLDPFDDPWWREATGRGIQRPRTDIFADYWLESRQKAPVAVRRVYREFERYVENQEHGLDKMMKALQQDAAYFEQFEKLEPDNNSREAQFHRRRQTMSVGALWPLLLELQRIESDQSERGRCFATLESYLVRRMIAGYQARSYDLVAIDLLKILQTAKHSTHGISDLLVEHLLLYSDLSLLWPSDDEIRRAVLARRLPQYAQRLVLVAIEQHLIKDWAARPNLVPNIQVEHIMPRQWQPELWPLPSGVEPTIAQTEREQLIETLGNLTLLNGRLNASISNSSWAIKGPAIRDSDNLLLNSRLLHQEQVAWTESDITRRGEWMYTVIVEIWPRG